MRKFTGKLYDEMRIRLAEISHSTIPELQQLEQSYQAVKAAIGTLKEYISTYSFENDSEEIHFFKTIKPAFHKELIYLVEIIPLVARRPLGCSKEKLIYYYEEHSERLRAYIRQHESFYLYYQTAQVADDQQLFIRQAETIGYGDHLELDTSFCTAASGRLSRLMAYELLLEYIDNRIIVAENRNVISLNKPVPNSQWTDSQAALIELAYALHSRGCIDYGRGDVKTIIVLLETLFQTNAGNFHRTFQSMRLRKKSRTVFLDNLRDSLEKRMDDTDRLF